MTADTLPRAKRPCGECPFRQDVAPGKFPACRYEALRATAGEPGREAPLDAPLFACHRSPEGREFACAGWLAVAGIEHLGIRYACASGRLDPAALTPGEDWPPLWGSYAETVVRMAGDR